PSQSRSEYCGQRKGDEERGAHPSETGGEGSTQRPTEPAGRCRKVLEGSGERVYPRGDQEKQPPEKECEADGLRAFQLAQDRRRRNRRKHGDQKRCDSEDAPGGSRKERTYIPDDVPRREQARTRVA